MADKIVNTIGKRKTAIARVTLKIGTGKTFINNKVLTEYIKDEFLQLKASEPLLISNLDNKYDVLIKVNGGGKVSQVDAIRQAIARALVEITKDEKLKKVFQLYDKTLLVSDTRQKEAYKPNSSKARAKRQKSYR